MNNLTKFFVSTSLLFSIGAAQAASSVIVNPANTNKVTSQDARELFLGKSKNFADGSSAVAVLPKSGKAREAFLTDVLGKTEAQYKSAWASLVFTGKAQPPKEVDTEEEVAKLVASNPNMVGVIDSGKVDKSVKATGQ